MEDISFLFVENLLIKNECNEGIRKIVHFN